jgi:hypothetical protein
MQDRPEGSASDGEGKGEAMKSSVAVLVSSMVLVMGAALLPMPAEAGAADWRLVRQSSYGDALYYEAASVKRLEGQAVSVRARLGAAEYQYEIRCGKKEARLIERDAGGQDSTWFPIATGSDEELIYQEVCP